MRRFTIFEPDSIYPNLKQNGYWIKFKKPMSNEPKVFCSICDSEDCKCKLKILERAEAYEKLLKEIIQENECSSQMVYRIETLIERYSKKPKAHGRQ